MFSALEVLSPSHVLGLGLPRLEGFYDRYKTV
jgi:hypothetical protein